MNIIQYRDHMMQYQKIHKIEGQCVANSIYYLDMLESLEPGRHKPICGVLVVGGFRIIAHVWIEDVYKNQTIECSYEYFAMPSNEKTYFRSFSDFSKRYSLPDDMKHELVTSLCMLSGHVTQLTLNEKLCPVYVKALKADLIVNYDAVCSLPIGQGTRQFSIARSSTLQKLILGVGCYGNRVAK